MTKTETEEEKLAVGKKRIRYVLFQLGSELEHSSCTTANRVKVESKTVLLNLVENILGYLGQKGEEFQIKCFILSFSNLFY